MAPHPCPPELCTYDVWNVFADSSNCLTRLTLTQKQLNFLSCSPLSARSFIFSLTLSNFLSSFLSLDQVLSCPSLLGNVYQDLSILLRCHITWAHQRDYLNLLIQIKYSICATEVYSDILAFCHSIFVPIYQNFKASYFAYAAVLHTYPRSSFCNISISFMLSTFHISLLDSSLCPN